MEKTNEEDGKIGFGKDKEGVSEKEVVAPKAKKESSLIKVLKLKIDCMGPFHGASINPITYIWVD